MGSRLTRFVDALCGRALLRNGASIVARITSWPANSAKSPARKRGNGLIACGYSLAAKQKERINEHFEQRNGEFSRRAPLHRRKVTLASLLVGIFGASNLRRGAVAGQSAHVQADAKRETVQLQRDAAAEAGFEI